MKKLHIFFLFILFISWLGFFYLAGRRKSSLETKFVLPKSGEISRRSDGSPSLELKPPGNYYLLRAPRQVYQTFNNCGPATLAMILSWYGLEVSQKELGGKMRPFQNPQGNNDDKTIFPEEFVAWAQKYNLKGLRQANGSIETLKLLVANGFPVVVKTWLRPNEDIGHFRIVRGFDQKKKVVIEDDSYHGPNKRISYFDLLSLWQPFNYGYIVVYPQEKESTILAILGKEKDEETSWRSSLERALKERELDPENIYPRFNLAVSYYHLGDYAKSVEIFEQIEEKLPKRMLWYQIEPILAHQKLQDHSKVLAVIEKILSEGNRAFAELYQIRGEIYLSQGKKEVARAEFEKALFYNQSFEPAKKVLENLD